MSVKVAPIAYEQSTGFACTDRIILSLQNMVEDANFPKDLHPPLNSPEKSMGDSYNSLYNSVDY